MEDKHMMGMMMDSPSNWKLYDNPHYFRHQQQQQHHPYASCVSRSRSSHRTCDHRTTFSSPMGNRNVNLSDLDNALAEIKELRAELEIERRTRKMVEALNAALAKEASEEKGLREAAERTCGRIGEEITRVRVEAERAMKEAEDERRMLRMAEAMREERVQMKLGEAKILMEEKIKEMMPVEKNDNCKRTTMTTATGQEEKRDHHRQRTVENPHIKRGIKGMEFPKAVRVRGNGTSSSPSSREGSSGGHLGSNLECQRAQLRVLMRNRSSVSSTTVVGSGENLVM